MSSARSHYFGAYLLIEVEKIEKEVKLLKCEAGHRCYSGQFFCSTCGKEVKEHVAFKIEYPFLFRDILNDIHEDIVTDITPIDVQKRGCIIAISNYDDATRWKYIIEGQLVVDTVHNFPGSLLIDAMKDALRSNLATVIEELHVSPYVISVSVECGYVLNMEY